MKKTLVLIVIVCVILGVYLWISNFRKPDSSADKDFTKENQDASLVIDEENEADIHAYSEYKVDCPLNFPIPSMRYNIILNIPDSRLPGAPRSYRGSQARHRGLDIYTGKCGLLVTSVEDGIVIDLTKNEKFPNSKIRDNILGITQDAGFTPEPILENLHGCSIVIYHGNDEAGSSYYSRMSHLENFSHDWNLGDHISRGEIIGYVGASGTSAQFKVPEEKETGCHLHFEWHMIVDGEDKILGLDERDNDLKRKLYYDLFTSKE